MVPRERYDVGASPKFVDLKGKSVPLMLSYILKLGFKIFSFSCKSFEKWITGRTICFTKNFPHFLVCHFFCFLHVLAHKFQVHFFIHSSLCTFSDSDVYLRLHRFNSRSLGVCTGFHCMFPKNPLGLSNCSFV